MGGKTEVGVRPQQALRTLKEETVLVPALQRALKRSLLVLLQPAIKRSLLLVRYILL